MQKEWFIFKGGSIWSTLLKESFQYDYTKDFYAIQVAHPRIKKISMAGKYYVACSNESDHLWELLSSTTMWFIWKAWCMMMFEGRELPPVESVVAIWNELVANMI